MIHPVLVAVFQALDAARVRWCLLRIPANLAAPSGDIDLLVARADVAAVARALRPLAFVRLPRRDGIHFLTYHAATAQWLWLHFATDLAFGPYSVLRTRAEAGCLARRQRLGALTVLAPADAFWALLLHCLLDKGSIPARHQARLHALVASVRGRSSGPPGPLAAVVAAVCPPGWTPGRILACMHAGDWPAVESLGPRLAAAWLEREGIGLWQMRRYCALDLLDRVINLRARRGVSLALVGPDGAGKSTLAAALAESFPFPTELIYMGLTGGRLPLADRLRVPVLVVAGRVLVLWARYLLGRYHQARGRLVIFDRYIYDAVAPPPRVFTPGQRGRQSRTGRAARWIEGHACPAPDLLVVLDAPGAVLYHRKGEYSPEELELWRQRFLGLRHRIPRTAIVDATQPQDCVRTQVIARIWRRYAARWSAN